MERMRSIKRLCLDVRPRPTWRCRLTADGLLLPAPVLSEPPPVPDRGFPPRALHSEGIRTTAGGGR
jgi:hypothetical protein